MALSQYTRNNLLDIIRDSTSEPNIGSQVVVQDRVNRAARMLYVDMDLRSAKRKAVITPNIFDDIYEYALPSDFKAFIDVKPQASFTRSLNSRVRLVTPEEFDRRKSSKNLMVSLADDDMARLMLVNIDVNDTIYSISSFDSLTADGSNWAAFGDAENVTIDTDNKVQGGGSIKFDLVGAGTTAGVYNAGITAISVGTDVFNTGIAFLRGVYINDTTNLTNFILRIGSSSSNYYQVTVTTDHSGNTLVNGYNSLRFPFSSKSTTGTPDNSSITYVALYMTKSSGKSDDSYRFDDLSLHLGEIYEVFYYSKYPWQRDNQTYAENSAGGTDYINADTEEIDLIAAKCRMEFARARRDREEFADAKAEYLELKEAYEYKYPTERLYLEGTYGH